MIFIFIPGPEVSKTAALWFMKFDQNTCYCWGAFWGCQMWANEQKSYGKKK
jgi:hypothetical protein